MAFQYEWNIFEWDVQLMHLHPTIISIWSLFIPRSSFCSNFICKNKLFWIENYISRNCIIEFWIDIQTKQIVKYFQVRNQWDLLIRRYLPSVLVYFLSFSVTFQHHTLWRQTEYIAASFRYLYHTSYKRSYFVWFNYRPHWMHWIVDFVRLFLNIIT